MSADARSLKGVRQGERVAFRLEATTSAKLAETLVAFANSRGGTVYVGAEPRSGRALGLADPGAALERALDAAHSTDPPLIIPLPQIAELDGQELIVIDVPAGLPHVYGVGGKYLCRDGVRNEPIGPDPLHRLMMARGAASFETLVPADAGPADIDWGLADQYRASLKGLPGSETQTVLLQRGCLARDGDALRPTNAGLLLFGIDPQRWLRSSEILVARYAGTTMDDRFVKEEISGTLPEQMRRAEAFVAGNMRQGVRLHGLERTEEAEYPLEVVREAIVNAVAHREYQIRGDEIRILLFSDRIEFYSPGRLPGHVTVDNMVDERFSRNEIIVQVLSDLGFIERLGYGIDRMIRATDRAGLSRPHFEETAAGFRVTLFGLGDALMSDERDSRRWRHLGLNERQEKAMEYLVEKGRIANRDYQELCPEVSAETIRRDLADLVRKNLLLKIGEKRATYYIFK